jgi:hypothetical protein
MSKKSENDLIYEAGKKHYENLAYGLKIQIILDWSESKPNFDPSIIMSLQKQYVKRGEISNNQKAMVDDIMFKYKIEDWI